jgi:predicted component of type VI protein secretion system
VWLGWGFVATLRIQNGPRAGQTFEVLGELVIGREGASLVIEDDRVSRRHAIVRALPGALEVEDLGSTNGTFVDGRRLDGRATVSDGAEIRLGTTVLEVLGGVPLQSTRQRQVADPAATRLNAEPADSGAAGPRVARAGRARGRPVESEPMPQPEPVGVAPVVLLAPVEQFSPPAMRRSRGLASRSWVPVALSFGTVILTALALVIYFAAR